MNGGRGGPAAGFLALVREQVQASPVVVEAAEIDPRIPDPPDRFGQGRNQRTAPVCLAHRSPGPAHEGINKLV